MVAVEFTLTLLTMRQKEVAVVSLYDVDSPRCWSGTPLHILAHLRNQVRIHTFAPAIPRLPRPVAAKFASHAQRGEKYLWTRDMRWARMGSRLVRDRLARMSLDHILVFNPADAASLKVTAPITILIDATWKQFTETYRPFLRLKHCQETLEQGATGERLGFDRASTLLCLTRWAAEGIRREYPAYIGKIQVISPGANFLHAPFRQRILRNIADKEGRTGRSVLFIAAEPQRKGIDIVLHACTRLHQRGIKVTLNCVGFNFAPKTRLPSFVRCWGHEAKRLSLVKLG
jgi:glycosyltransferase involved in cell wall biosynthesis